MKTLLQSVSSAPLTICPGLVGYAARKLPISDAAPRFHLGTTALSIILVMVGQLAFSTEVQGGTLWGNLKPGLYSVGYRAVFTYDLTRPFIKWDAQGREIVPAGKGRQMQISVWYPAHNAGRKPLMRFEEYVYLAAQELEFSPPTLEKRRQAVDDFMKGPLSQGASADRLWALLRMKTNAIKDAIPAKGSFPLVVYAHVPPSGNSILCEYLASHGFVVAAISWKGTFEYNLDVGLTGVETQIKDIEFVIGVLKADKQVDSDKIAIIGMSFGAISALGLQTRNGDVDALISLDGGIGSVFGANVVQRTAYYSLSRITTPLIHLYGSNVTGTDLSYLYSLKYSERYLVGFTGMRHRDFTNIGMFEHFVPNISGKPGGNTKIGFEWVSRYALDFLRTYLGGDRESLEFLQNSPERNGAPPGLFTVERKARLNPPPSSSQLQAMIEGKGIQSVVALYKQLKEMDAQPLPQQTLSEVGIWLGQKGDWNAVKAIIDLRLDSYPSSAWANYAAAEAHRRLGDKERARHLYEKTLLLLATDFDPELDFSRRRAIYEGARRNLDLSDRK
ncbi:MAG TPA: hypothetical protein VJ023_15130 [Pyrinomonadaceae bacterium]|nr:hypothetical protein [Pyrinomonadaceae bacterium]